MTMQNKSALLVLDLINEIVHPRGKYANEGYLAQVIARRVLENTALAIDRARIAGIPVIYVVVGFSETYAECPKNSPVLSIAKQDQRLILGTWATQIHDSLKVAKGEQIVSKNRVSPFFQTNLDLLLRTHSVDTVLLTGVSTEFVILATAMSAHDLDYNVVVLEDATSSSNDERHRAALTILGRIAKISSVGQALPASGEEA